MKLGLVLMAAGAGTRFGGGKLTAEFRGAPLYRRALSAVPAGVFEAVAVVSAIAQLLEEAKAQGFLPVVNDRPEDGVSRTIALGLDALGAVDAAMFLAADQPLLTAKTVKRLAEEFLTHPTAIVAPAAEGRRGNPCLFPAECFPALRALTGDRGGAGIIRANQQRLRLVEVPPEEAGEQAPVEEGAEILPQRQLPEGRAPWEIHLYPPEGDSSIIEIFLQPQEAT